MSSEIISKQIDNFDNYTVTSDGKIYNKTGKELKPDKTHDGYLRVTLYSNGKSVHRPVHRLVAETFIPNPKNKSTINHIDGDKTNNNIYNLEWNTRSENSKHAYSNGLNHCHFTDEERKRGQHNNALKTRKPVRIVETNEEFASATECAKTKGFDVGNIASCCNGNRKKHKGYHFEWVED